MQFLCSRHTQKQWIVIMPRNIVVTLDIEIKIKIKIKMKLEQQQEEEGIINRIVTLPRFF